MGYDISKLPAYTSEQSRKFMLKSILGARTVALLADHGAFDPTAMGSTAIQLLDTDVVWQDGSECKIAPNGGVSLAQDKLVVQPIAMRFELCERKLTKTYAVEDLKASGRGEKMDGALFIGIIGEDIAGKNQSEIEKLIWQGDTAGTGNMKFINGFLKQLSSGTYNLSAVNAGTVLERLQKAFLAMPIAVSGKEDFRIFVGKDTYNAYVAELANKNIYKATEDYILFGTTARLEVVDGLNDSNKAVFGRVRNFQSGGDVKDTSIEHWYSKDDGDVKVEARFSIGATAIYKQEIGVLDLKATA